jgi:hypothetical protein
MRARAVIVVWDPSWEPQFHVAGLGDSRAVLGLMHHGRPHALPMNPVRDGARHFAQL